MTKLSGIFFIAIAVCAMLWVWLLVRLTLAGDVERQSFEPGTFDHLLWFMRYAAGPEIPMISIPFWGGFVLFVIGVRILFKRSKDE